MPAARFASADICDEFGAAAAVCSLPLRHYGASRSFCGELATVSCLGDNVLLRALVSGPGNGRILAVDGGGSLRTALMGDNVAAIAASSGWSGVIINGAVRDVSLLRGISIGILALGSCPRRPGKEGAGAAGQPVTFGGVVFRPGDVAYADEDGVVVVPAALARRA